jgi:hypothetical protein
MGMDVGAAGEGSTDQAEDIADAVARGHKVITWGGRQADDTSEIIALDPTVINILRRYGIAAPVAGGAAAASLMGNRPAQY